MATIGMDPSAVRALADELDNIANQLHALIGTTNGNVARMHAGWLGADAEQLVNGWQRRSRPALETIAGHVHTMARTARTQAQQQDVASGVSGAARAFSGAAAGSSRFAAPWDLLGPLAAGGTGLLWLTSGADLALRMAKVPFGKIPVTRLNLAVVDSAVSSARLAKTFSAVAGVAGGFGALIDGVNIGRDLVTGKNPTGHVVETVLDLVATKNIYVATGKTTYDATHWVLTETGPGRDFVDRQNEMALAEGRRAYHGDPTSPAASEALVRRYEGVSGFGHFLQDSGTASARGVGDMVADAEHSFGASWHRLWGGR